MIFEDINYFKQACKNIIGNKQAKAVNYAVNYARMGLTLTDIESARTQALYILSNITYWRGSIASETRSILKNFLEATK